MAKKSEKARTRAEAERHEVVRDIRELSSGTIASLTGERHYETLETIRENFRLLTIGALMGGKNFENWQDAWHYYEEYAKRQSPGMSGAKTKTRKVGYIHLALQKDKDRGEGWLLDVERIDPFGGQPFKQDYWFEEKREAEYWFNSIQGNEDILLLHHNSDLPPIKQYDLPGSGY